MKRQNKPSRKSNVDPRYDVNRTLTTYQPDARPGHRATSAPAEVVAAEVPKKHFTWKRALLVLFVLILTPLLVIGIWDYRNASGASEKMFGSSNVLIALLPTALDSTEGRTNILLIGYSADDPGHAGAKLTDSIMVVSLDKEDKTGFMLSVPRDLYVRIPEYGSAKINETFQAGENQEFSEAGYSSGGVGLLEKVIQQNFDLPIHYSVIINYSAVRDITDALEGITVTIESPDPRGLYDPNFKPEEGGPLQLTNGPHELDGQTALRLTRARGSTAGSYGFPQSDFNRTKNQQKVFAAIKSEINLQLMLDPRQNKDFFHAIADNVQTDIGLREVVPLYLLMNSVPDSGMRQINLSDVDKKNYLASYGTPNGQSALIPAAGLHDFSDIKVLIESLSQ